MSLSGARYGPGRVARQQSWLAGLKELAGNFLPARAHILKDRVNHLSIVLIERF